METYCHLIVRLSDSQTQDTALHTLGAVPNGMEWEHQETTDGVVVFYCMSGSQGWEQAEQGADALIRAGYFPVWTYCTHDEDAEALFSRYEGTSALDFIVSSAYVGEDEDTTGEGVSAEDLDNPELNEDDLRGQLGENAYCWARYDRWKKDLPALHTLGVFESLIEDVVGRE